MLRKLLSTSLPPGSCSFGDNQILTIAVGGNIYWTFHSRSLHHNRHVQCPHYCRNAGQIVDLPVLSSLTRWKKNPLRYLNSPFEAETPFQHGEGKPHFSGQEQWTRTGRSWFSHLDATAQTHAVSLGRRKSPRHIVKMSITMLGMSTIIVFVLHRNRMASHAASIQCSKARRTLIRILNLE